MRFRKVLKRVITPLVMLSAFVGCKAPTATSTPTPTPLPTSPPATPTSMFGDWIHAMPPSLLRANVDVGDYEMFISCQGEGSPTVVFEGGLGSYERWAVVLPATATFTRACRYNPHLPVADEAPRTTQQMVNDLRRLLTNAGVEGPYVLVGQSFGGFIVRLYAYQYPAEVVGMVLVDSPHEDLESRRQESIPPATWEEYQRLEAELLAAIEAHDGPLPVDIDQSVAQVRATGSFGELPLVVLADFRDYSEPRQFPPEFPDDLAEQAQQLWVTVAKPFAQVWLELQTELAGLSSNGTLVIAEESGHDIQADQPDLVIDAIRQVVEAAQR